jgi:alpha-D-ribose 1-methylphosphonate 5-triphosphate synthase subunit PhnI
MYIAVTGGERAIEASRELLAQTRRGDPSLPELDVAQLAAQFGMAVARVMAEGSLYDPQLAGLALKQALGDAVEAAFLLRAYRTTLPRWGYTESVQTQSMRVRRRVSAVFKDLPGGQLLGASFDYTQRLLDFDLLQPAPADRPKEARAKADDDNRGVPVQPLPDALEALVADGLLEPAITTTQAAPPDITREPPHFPLPRSARLQMLARADEGWLLGLGYATQRGYANAHPFAGELRVGTVAVVFVPDELGFPIELGEVDLTECQMLAQFIGRDEQPPQFTRGYGLAFGHAERKAMAMALVDRALRAEELGETVESPTQLQEFVLSQGDAVEASGFVQHLKLPHYVTFESELQLLRALRARPGDQEPKE